MFAHVRSIPLTLTALAFSALTSACAGGAEGEGEGEGEGELDSCSVITEEEAASIVGVPIVEVDDSVVPNCSFKTDADLDVLYVQVRLDTSASFCVDAPERADVEVVDLGDYAYVSDDSAELCEADSVVTINVIHPIGAPSYKEALRAVLEDVLPRL